MHARKNIAPILRIRSKSSSFIQQANKENHNGKSLSQNRVSSHQDLTRTMANVTNEKINIERNT
jgi:hypothetical protein